MPTPLQHPPLIIRMLHLLHLHHLRLLQHLDRIEPLIVLALHQMHSPKTPRPQGPRNREVGERIFPLGLAYGVGSTRTAFLRQGERGDAGLLRAGCLGRIAGVVGVVGGGVAVVGPVDHVPDAGNILRIRHGIHALHLPTRTSTRRRHRTRLRRIRIRSRQRTPRTRILLPTSKRTLRVRKNGTRLADLRAYRGSDVVFVLGRRCGRIMRVLGLLLLQEAEGRH